MRNELTLSAIERTLQGNCGDELAACKAVGVSLLFLNQWRKDDKDVDSRVLEATRVGRQGLVSAAIQRGVHGVQKAVYYKGAIVGYEDVYSDGLLTTLLKALPEFQKEAEGGGVHVNVQVANLMPRATTYEEWLAMKDQTMAPKAIAKQNDIEVIDASFVEVRQPAFAGIEL